MTTSPPAGHQGARRPAGLLVGLGLVLAVVAVALGSVLDAHASGRPVLQRRDAVAASTPATGPVVAPLQRILAGQHRARAPNYDGSAVGSSVAAETEGLGWTLPEGGGGAEINGRWYTEHALERMAPDTPQIRAELEARALGRADAAGLEPGTPEFGEWWAKNGPAPRAVPPSVVEAEIRSPGSTSVRVITNANGDVVTVIPR